MVYIPFVHSSLGPFILIVHPSISKKWWDLAFFSVELGIFARKMSVSVFLLSWSFRGFGLQISQFCIELRLSNQESWQWISWTVIWRSESSHKEARDNQMASSLRLLWFWATTFHHLSRLLWTSSPKMRFTPLYKRKTRNTITWNPRICEFKSPNSWIITHRIHGIFNIGDFCGKMYR